MSAATPRSSGGTLVELLRRAAARTLATKRPVLASYIEPLSGVDPLDAFASADGSGDRVYWARPSKDLAVAGVGTAVTVSPSGDGRFVTAARMWRALLDSGVRGGPGAADDSGEAPSADATATFGRRPMLLGGFRFDPERPADPAWCGFPDAWLAVPRLCLAVSPAGRWLTSNVLVRPGDDPARLASSLERDRSRLLGVGPVSESERAWALIEESFRPGSGLPDDEARGAHSNGSTSMLDHRSAALLGDATAVLGDGSTSVLGDTTAVLGDDSTDPASEDAERAAREAFLAVVAGGAAAVRAGALEKVVLARAVDWRPSEPPDAVAALRRLAARYPECHLFAIARGRRVFLGASPERLVRVEGRTVRATCLAGSIGRGASPMEDARQGAALLASAKDREEHAIVVRALTAALIDLCHDVVAPAAPVLLTMPDVHHLYTPVTARLRDGVELLDLVARLHPTPAVGGAVREAALDFIRTNETWDRGWYAAPVGWLDAVGNGEFAVALRSALLDGDRATLFAGCGVLGDSNPADEYEESELKLRAMREGLAGAVLADGAAGAS